MNAASNSVLRGELRRREALSGHTSWRVGGPAELYYAPADLADLQAFLAQLPPALPVLWLGLGSNLLVRDGGFRGAVIATHGALAGLERTGDTGVRAQAGVACAKLARTCTRWGFGEAAFFAGIPGTIGGALAMNAGAYGGETWTHVEQVDVIDRAGRLRRRPRTDYAIGYRSVDAPAPQEWFVAAQLRFAPDVQAPPGAIRALLARRKASQPVGQPSCGSVFRNPPGAQAWRLIDEAGLRGHEIGGAQISPMHANFIVNTGGATAADIEALIELVIERVAAVHGLRLVPEVRIVGERA